MIKGFRRSLKGEKRTSGSSNISSGNIQHTSLPAKSKLATTPPKKIIRAIYDYNAQGPGELSFAKGDFLYVVGSENATDWYEACDPPSNMHGMVPVTYFEVVSRQESIHTIPISGGENNTTSGGPISSPESISKQRISRTSNNSSSAASNRSPLYGIVLYDFKAERPDELQANSGESIIVIAQSNEEWFVAKPIGRLGGPGLIPISYVQIREVGSDKPVEDVQAAIRSAGVPKVEEWKRMAAEYKASSIPLGKFDDENAAAAAASRQLKALSLQRDLRKSSNTTGSSTDEFNNATVTSPSVIASNGVGVNAIRHSNAPYVVNASVDRYAFDGGRYWYLVVAELSNGKYRNLCRYYQDFYDFQIKLLDEFPDEAGRTGKPRTLPFMPGPLTYVNDSISSQRRANLDDYVRNLITMPGYVSRSPIVQQLFALRTGDVETPYQTNIMPQPPSRQSGHETVYDSSQYDANGLNGGGNGVVGEGVTEVGVPTSGASIPAIASMRNSALSTSTREPSAVSSSAVSISSQERQLLNNQYEPSHNPSHSQASIPTQHSLLEPVIPKAHSRMASESTVTGHLAHQPQLSSVTNGDDTIVAENDNDILNPTSDPSSTIPTPPVEVSSIKVKVFYQDDLIAIKIPSTISFTDLHERISQRLGLDNPTLLNKDADNGGLNEIANDEEFRLALGDRSKLVLYAR